MDRQRPHEQDKIGRRSNFLPVEENLTEEQAKAEASRGVYRELLRYAESKSERKSA